MSLLSSATALLLLSGSAAAQQLNSWGRGVFGYSQTFDADPSTYAEIALSTGPRYSVLLNSGQTFAGFYIQSSSDNFITDYTVSAVLKRATDGVAYKQITVGKVCGATSNFTRVLFYNDAPDSLRYPAVYSDVLFVEVTGSSSGTTAIINDIYPIYANDPVFDPSNTGPCAAPTTSSVVVPTSTSTSSAVVTPTPTVTTVTLPVPTSTDVPATPTLNPWKSGKDPRGFSLFPFAIGNSIDADHPADAMIDFNETTYFASSSSTFSLLLNDKDSYQGLYIKSVPGSYITDISLKVFNQTSVTTEPAGAVTGAASDFVLMRFHDHLGNLATIETDQFYFTVGGAVGGTPKIAEIYPIYAGDVIVEPAVGLQAAPGVVTVDLT
ncbi:hypothetical protein B0T17DRAFT_236436 [Bombardia bombarda]|uniref:Uncharacterized protein n=1 Tax=Bombardia bombarda TaxID=252184 RepID=A0AA39XBP1_9PEZI|nr:hypothetical protein B0T17DRAFT_236436 [Bombardia bombarda]